LLVLLVLVGALAVYVRFVYLPAHRVTGEAAYVLPRTLEVVDTTAEIRSVLGRLQAGDQVRVVARTAHWSKVLLPGNQTGWVETKYLLDAATYRRGETLLKSLEGYPHQAAGHTSTAVNLRLEPARDSIVLMELAPNQALDVFARRTVDRPVDASAPASAGSRGRDVWYLVRASQRAGWVLGRYIDLDVPAGISIYAEGVNMVAWLVLKTVEDGGKQVPEYLVADRIGGDDLDFNHIRVFTWWVKNHKYVTAYVESNLAGHFPITTKEMTDANYYAQPSPYFRLRLTDADGRKYQKVYGLFDTVVHAVGTVDGWDSDAMPAPAKERRPAGRRRVPWQRHRGRR